MPSKHLPPSGQQERGSDARDVLDTRISHSAPAAQAAAPRNMLVPVTSLVILAAIALTFWVLQTQLAGTSLWSAIVAPEPGNLRQLIVHDSALPRIAMTLICGAALALAGAIAQQVLRNPLAEPMTLGIFPGAYLALTIATLWAPAWIAAQRELIALIGGALAMLLVFALAWRQRLASLAVILSGMIVSFYCGSLTLALAISHFQLLAGLMIWGGGALDQQGWHASAALFARLVVAGAAVFLLRRPLSLFEAGESTARGLGVSLMRTRFAALGLAVALTACVVSAVGVIGFIGLAAPTLARLAGARRFQQRLFWAPVLGAALLWLTDAMVQAVAITGVFGSQLIPTGAVTSLIGAPMLLWLLRQLKSRPDLRSDVRDSVALIRHKRPLRLIVGLVLLAAFAIFLSMLIGRGLDGWRIVSVAQLEALAFWRVPHTAAAIAAGVMLGLAGTLVQRMTGNPIASPDLIGVSSGGALGIVAAVFLFAAPGPLELFVSCLTGSIVTLLFLLWVGRRAMYAPERLLLIGVAIGALFQAVSGTVTASGDARAALLLNFVVGSTYYVQPVAAAVAVLVALVGLGAAPLLARWLELLSLGEGASRSLGVRVDVARLAVLLLTALLTATSTLIVGPLSFVGLMAPHIARSMGVCRAREQLLASAAVGVVLMVLAQWCGNLLLFPNEMPAGLMAALIGGPYLLWSLLKAAPRAA
ncbi:Fe(3+)-hydroxamate ABC transporter permease FhuB [Paraburkholderia nemoris]|uniref:Iron(3+)-hydroxamate import system permease protein FhuB n=1 Tax=Paraburkholderia nemoris TaxID=2793076 RepID=A0ABN7LH16_9BURK|nr:MULTISPECIES: Fe(3+)-hydroxamate ABC transporter permease FhuB [Paraburkholderia]CAE6750107.1 Iron(3+)-hydroxamate import system permease protein FhuB [Paraburkholderia nemoris]CAE6777483.1 Iron(3+)-hydroxamate import system permease protein FhuB [Paraburkholderia nemoris]CAE6832797.1 Iron(3+)-hydroxamate import system permease protein FhuB [Paraburkholderia nemoris]CAE6897596.1 Iron(3+)-hydroxamate import system permease protein FhuB [Paraburkholderia nemoris]